MTIVIVVHDLVQNRTVVVAYADSPIRLVVLPLRASPFGIDDDLSVAIGVENVRRLQTRAGSSEIEEAGSFDEPPACIVVELLSQDGSPVVVPV